MWRRCTGMRGECRRSIAETGLYKAGLRSAGPTAAASGIHASRSESYARVL